MSFKIVLGNRQASFTTQLEVPELGVNYGCIDRVLGSHHRWTVSRQGLSGPYKGTRYGARDLADTSEEFRDNEVGRY